MILLNANNRLYMGTVKLIFKFIEGIAFCFWGLTIIDIIPLITSENIKDLEMFNGVDNWIKTTAALIGLLYYSINISHRLKRHKIEREHLLEDLRTKRIQNNKNENIK